MVEEVEAAEALLVLGRRRKEQNYELGELKPLAERMVGHSFQYFLINSCRYFKCFGSSRIDFSKSQTIPRRFQWVYQWRRKRMSWVKKQEELGEWSWSLLSIVHRLTACGTLVFLQDFEDASIMLTQLRATLESPPVLPDVTTPTPPDETEADSDKVSQHDQADESQTSEMGANKDHVASEPSPANQNNQSDPGPSHVESAQQAGGELVPDSPPSPPNKGGVTRERATLELVVAELEMSRENAASELATAAQVLLLLYAEADSTRKMEPVTTRRDMAAQGISSRQAARATFAAAQMLFRLSCKSRETRRWRVAKERMVAAQMLLKVSSRMTSSPEYIDETEEGTSQLRADPDVGKSAQTQSELQTSSATSTDAPNQGAVAGRMLLNVSSRMTSSAWSKGKTAKGTRLQQPAPDHQNATYASPTTSSAAPNEGVVAMRILLNLFSQMPSSPVNKDKLAEDTSQQQAAPDHQNVLHPSPAISTDAPNEGAVAGRMLLNVSSQITSSPVNKDKLSEDTSQQQAAPDHQNVLHPSPAISTDPPNEGAVAGRMLLNVFSRMTSSAKSKGKTANVTGQLRAAPDVDKTAQTPSESHTSPVISIDAPNQGAVAGQILLYVSSRVTKGTNEQRAAPATSTDAKLPAPLVEQLQLSEKQIVARERILAGRIPQDVKPSPIRYKSKHRKRKRKRDESTDTGEVPRPRGHKARGKRRKRLATEAPVAGDDHHDSDNVPPTEQHSSNNQQAVPRKRPGTGQKRPRPVSSNEGNAEDSSNQLDSKRSRSGRAVRLPSRFDL